MLLSALLPIYILVALGFLAVKSNYFPSQGIRFANIFTVRMVVPAVIFLAVFNNSGKHGVNWPFLSAYAGGSLIAYFVALASLKWLFKMPASRAALLSMGAAGSNTIMLGLPIALAIIPDIAETYFSNVLIAETILIIPLSLALAEQFAAGRPSFQRLVNSTFKNPVFVAIVLGLVTPHIFHTLWSPLETALSYIRNAMSGLSLLLIGGMLAMIKLRRLEPAVALVAACKLLVMPLVIFALFHAFGVTVQVLYAGMLFASLSVFGIYANFCEAAGESPFGAGVFFVSTLFVPLSLWFWLGLT